MVDDPQQKQALKLCQLSGFALAGVRWQIPPETLLLGYGWSWLENLVMAGVKIIPLGQTDGQRLLGELIPAIPAAIKQAQTVGDNDIGAGNPALSIASSRHQFQYTRLFRS